MKWFAEFSPTRKRAFIVDADGFIVIGPHISSLAKAIALCRSHNADIEALTNELLGTNQPLSVESEKLINDILA